VAGAAVGAGRLGRRVDGLAVPTTADVDVALWVADAWDVVDGTVTSGFGGDALTARRSTVVGCRSAVSRSVTAGREGADSNTPANHRPTPLASIRKAAMPTILGVVH
jgi:hypothetical protein